MVTANKVNINSILDFVGIEQGPARAAVLKYTENVVKDGGFDEYAIELIAGSFEDGYMAALAVK